MKLPSKRLEFNKQPSKLKPEKENQAPTQPNQMFKKHFNTKATPFIALSQSKVQKPKVLIQLTSASLTKLQYDSFDIELPDSPLIHHNGEIKGLDLITSPTILRESKILMVSEEMQQYSKRKSDRCMLTPIKVKLKLDNTPNKQRQMPFFMNKKSELSCNSQQEMTTGDNTFISANQDF